MRGSLNWGPLTWINEVALTYGWWMMRRKTYADSFHTYTLEWTADFLRVYVDTRLHHMLDLRFDVPFFERGRFPPVVVQDGSDYVVLKDPWVNGSVAAPFDQSGFPFFSLFFKKILEIMKRRVLFDHERRCWRDERVAPG